MEYTFTRPMWTADKTVYREGTREVRPEHARELGLDKSAVTPVAKPQASEGPASLDTVRFASAQARIAAEEAGMVAGDFEGAKPSSADGFTKPDVQKVIDAQDAGEEG